MKASFHDQVLARAFETAPSTYAYTRSVQHKNGSSCACGHFIKTGFLVENQNGHVVQLGSECINRYQELDHIMQAIIAEQERQKKLKAEAEASVLAGLSEQLMSMQSIIHKAMNMKAFVPRVAFDNRGFPKKRIDSLKKVESRIKVVKAMIEALEPIMSDIEKVISEKEQELKAKEEKIKAMRAESDYMGTIGERMEFNGEVIFQREDLNYIITKIKVGKNIVTTFGIKQELEKGETIKFKATVKAHQEYQDERQTLVIRAKIIT